MFLYSSPELILCSLFFVLLFQYLIPLLLEKLSSDLHGSKIDSLDTIVSICHVTHSICHVTHSICHVTHSICHVTHSIYIYHVTHSICHVTRSIYIM